jgi:hypothetical protein
MIQIKLVGIVMIFHCTELHFCKCDGSWVVWVVAVKPNMNLNKFQPLSTFPFFVFTKIMLLEVAHPLKI